MASFYPDPCETALGLPLKAREVMTGGSYLCAPNYCQTHQPATSDFAASRATERREVMNS